MYVRAQSAIEFISTYSFMIVILIGVVALLFILSNVPQANLNPQCNAYSGFTCTDAVYSNTTQGSALLIAIKFTQPGAFRISSFGAVLNGASLQGYCAPNVARPGVTVYCLANFTRHAGAGSLYSGTFTITGDYCAYGAGNLTNSDCSLGFAFTYSGGLRTQGTQVKLSDIYYVPITISNNQNAATPDPMEARVNFTPTAYSKYERPDLGNIRFFYKGTGLHSWCEANCSSSSSSNSIFWVRLPLSIPASSVIQVNMYFMPNSIVDYDKDFAGEAPQLSSTYAQYDNGFNIFRTYDNFAGNALDPGKWTAAAAGNTLGSCGATPNVNFAYAPNVVNGITISTNGVTSWAGISSLAGLSPPGLAEAFVTSYGSSGSHVVGEAVSNSPSANAYFINVSGTGSYAIANGVIAATIVAGLPVGGATNFNSLSAKNSNGILALGWVNSVSLSSYVNYTPFLPVPITSGNYALPQRTYMEIGLPYCEAKSSMRVQWARERAYPPNGSMPSASFGSVTKA